MQNATQAARARLVAGLVDLQRALTSGCGQIPIPLNHMSDLSRATVPAGIKWPGVDWPKFPEAIAVRSALQAVREALRNGKPVLFDETIAPRAVLAEIQRFLLNDVGEDLESVPAPPSMLRKLDGLIEDLSGKAATAQPKAILDATAGKLVFLKGKPITLTNGEKYVLAILVKKRTASFAELQAASERPDRVLGRLLTKYPKLKRFISLPGGGGKGGYSTTIEPSEADGQN